MGATTHRAFCPTVKGWILPYRIKPLPSKKTTKTIHKTQPKKCFFKGVKQYAIIREIPKNYHRFVLFDPPRYWVI